MLAPFCAEGYWLFAGNQSCRPVSSGISVGLSYYCVYISVGTWYHPRAHGQQIFQIRARQLVRTDDGGNFQKGLLNYYFIAKLLSTTEETAVEEKPPTLGALKALAVPYQIRLGPERTTADADWSRPDCPSPFHSTANAWPAKFSCHCSSLLLVIEILEGIRIIAT